MKKLSLMSTLTAGFLLAACAVGPDYKKPELPVPNAWEQQETGRLSAPAKMTARWWQDFDDPVLDKFIALALQNSTDRKIAASRILQARGIERGAFGALFPSVQGEVQANRGEQQLINGKYPAVNSYQPMIDASYEFDLFGGNRRSLEAAEANVDALKAGYADTTISLIAEIVTDYVQYRSLQHQIDLIRRTAKAQKQTYELSLGKYTAGTGNRFSTAQAEAQYKTTDAKLPDYKRLLTLLEYKLEVLMGVMPNSLKGDLAAMKPVPKVDDFVVLDSPASVIERRPDVQSAERSLASATALQGVAISKLYPKISISALFGYAETSLAPGSQIWAAGGSLLSPLFNFQAIEGQIDTADAQQKEAYERYRHVVLRAIADVEGGLVSLKRERERNKSLTETVRAAKDALDMARDRYQAGISTMTDVLQSEQLYYAAQSDLITSEANLANDIATLNKALGIGTSSVKADGEETSSWWLF